MFCSICCVNCSLGIKSQYILMTSDLSCEFVVSPVQPNNMESGQPSDDSEGIRDKHADITKGRPSD